MAACASGGFGPSGASPCSDNATLGGVRVAAGVYAFIGDLGAASRDNRAEVGNGGFIVGDSGIVVVNTGGSYCHGRRMLEAAEHIGGRPVLLAIITQPLQEFVMGSAAFAERGIPVLAQQSAAAMIERRCHTCLRNLTDLLGTDAMSGTRVLRPQRTVEGSQAIDVGGRRLELWHFGWAQTPGDLVVLDPTSGVLFAGALVSIGRVPDVHDADLDGWQRALTALQVLPFERLVPGYGPVGSRSDLAPVGAYLHALRDRVAALLADGASLGEAIGAAPLPAYATWSLYDSLHRRNVQQVYLQLESQAFDSSAP
jgi:glyoxylase-like metal-dependent hydrolase (beta-lactamase superfamily II)